MVFVWRSGGEARYLVQSSTPATDCPPGVPDYAIHEAELLTLRYYLAKGYTLF
jgi:hypothetical protein